MAFHSCLRWLGVGALMGCIALAGLPGKEPAAPVCVRVLPDGKRCLVASLWARQLAVIDLAALDQADKKPAVDKTVALPFAPRLLLPVADSDKVIVADAFGGKLAVVDAAKGEVDSVRNHN